MGKVIAVCNQKGGVGKTTTSINLAACLAMIGAKTLLVDVDPQSNATSGVGIDKTTITNSIYNVMLGTHSLPSIIKQTAVCGMDIAPADLNLTGAQIELVSAFNREKRLKQSIAPVKTLYDFIVIDCPPSLGLLTINALTAADTTLIPLQCEYYAMEGLSQLLHTIKLVQDHLNPKLEIEGVVLTMADYRTKLTNEVIAEARSFFKEKIYNAIIPRSIRLSEAPGHGQPVALYDKGSSGTVAYQQLALEVAQHNAFVNNDLCNEVCRGEKESTKNTAANVPEQNTGGSFTDTQRLEPSHQAPNAAHHTEHIEPINGGDNGQT